MIVIVIDYHPNFGTFGTSKKSRFHIEPYTTPYIACRNVSKIVIDPISPCAALPRMGERVRIRYIS